MQTPNHLKHIRNTHDVPAREGGKVVYDSPAGTFRATIVDGYNGRLVIRTEPYQTVYRVHPNDPNLSYETE